MLKSFEGSKYMELLSTSNKKLIDLWKIHNEVQKIYDKESKTYIYNIGGQSPIAKMCLPKDKKQKLDLHYPLLVLQICFPVNANMLLNIGVTSYSHQRKRITLSSNQKSKKNALFTVLPFAIENRNSWIYVLVDIEEIMSATWNDTTFKCIESLAFSGAFQLKSIFLLSRDLTKLIEGSYVIKYNELPKQMRQRNISTFFKYVSSSHSSVVYFDEVNIENTSISSAKSSRNSLPCSLISGRFKSQKFITVTEDYNATGNNFLKEKEPKVSFEKPYQKPMKLNLSALTFSENVNLENTNMFDFDNSVKPKNCCSDKGSSDRLSVTHHDDKIEVWLPLYYDENS